MKKELIEFIEKYEISPFEKTGNYPKQDKSIFKTRDARAIFNKIASKISSEFHLTETKNLLSFFNFSQNIEEIKKRQEFFKEIKEKGKIENNFLKNISKPDPNWKPPYDIVVVTENTETFQKLKEMNCPTQLIISENDISLLENRDLVQIIESDEYGMALESLPQSVFIKSLEEVYLERHLEQLSGWEENLNSLEGELKEKYSDLLELLELTKTKKESISREEIESNVEKANEEISDKIKDLTISGSSLVPMISKGILPEEIKTIIREIIKEKDLPEDVITIGVPLKVDEEELEKKIRNQSLNEYTSQAEKIKNNSEKIKEVPKRLKDLTKDLIYFDFISRVSHFMNEEMNFPEISEELFIKNSKNNLIENPQPITFHLDKNSRCSILTGANSGGKTTLIEHIIQLISLLQIGLPAYGEIKLPLFTEIYYFAKNKGAMNKGAFENLLTQMSEIKTGEKTLILADEIEAVTEPGVAGNIISATADYFLKKGCFLIIATHLGHEIKDFMPRFSRIDGIEAKGLDENFELIVDHNPVLGRIAHSTPEFIVEKMANSPKTSNEYFRYLNGFLKNPNSNG